MDNIFNERFWRSIKYEEVYIKDYQSISEAKNGIESYVNLYKYQLDTTKSLLERTVQLEENSDNKKGQHQYYVSDVPSKFKEVAELFLGNEIEEIKKLDHETLLSF